MMLNIMKVMIMIMTMIMMALILTMILMMVKMVSMMNDEENVNYQHDVIDDDYVIVGDDNGTVQLHCTTVLYNYTVQL